MMIDKGMKPEEIFKKFPQYKFQMITVLTAAGVKCAGVGSQSETPLGDIFAGQKDSDKLEKLIQDLTALIPPEGDESPLTVTDRARDKVDYLLEANDQKGWGFRIALKPGGCSGFEYIMEIAEKTKEGEREYVSNDTKIFIHERDFPRLKHLTLDYQESLMESGFKVQNPNATGSCGCGISNSF